MDRLFSPPAFLLLLPARRDLTLTASVPDVIERALEVASLAGWTIEREEADRIWLRTPSSIASWGERILVHGVTLSGGRTQVVIESKPVAQLFDWGKSRENVEFMATALAGGE